jgi:twitching motility protein PilT
MSENWPQRLHNWLARAIQAGASDLHLVAGYPPVLRLHGDIVELAEPPLEGQALSALLEAICPAAVFAQLQAQKNVDWAFDLTIDGKLCRFRANLFFAGGNPAACIRVVPTAIPTFEWAGFPEKLARWVASLLDGLVIVTGATGSGKTTTLAMIVNLLNQQGGYRIITVKSRWNTSIRGPPAAC